MRGAQILALASVIGSFSCKSTQSASNPSELSSYASFREFCEQAVPGSDAEHTFRMLMEASGADRCDDAEIRLQGITLLVLNEKAIKDLRPLEKLTHIQWLHLYGNQIRDLSPLANFSQLKDLVLDSNAIEDLTPLAKLTNLQELYLSRNQIESIVALGELKKLYILNLSQNRVKNVAALSELEELLVLDLKNNPVTQEKTPETCPIKTTKAQVLRDFCSQ